MKLETIKIREQKQVIVSKKELIAAFGFDPEIWNLHGAYVSTMDAGNVTFGVSKKSPEPAFEMVI